MPRRPDFSRDERSDVPIHERIDTAFRRALDARDGDVGCAAAHPYRRGREQFMDSPHSICRLHWDDELVAAAILAAVEGGILPPGNGEAHGLMSRDSPGLGGVADDGSAGRDAAALRRAGRPPLRFMAREKVPLISMDW